MPTELEIQAAKAPCPHCDGTGGELLSICCGAPEHCDVENLCGDCHDWTGFSRCEECGETGLRWPTLSQKCEVQHYSYSIPGQITTIACGEFGNGCPGRVPNCSLEKVLAELHKKYRAVIFIHREDMIGFHLHEINVDEEGTLAGGNTPLEAALAALLSAS